MNILNISSQYNFLKSLAKWTYEKYGDNPITFSNVKILIPNRRACNELKRIFLELSNNKAILLPTIKTISDIDYDNLLLEKSSYKDLEKLKFIPQPISSIKYKLLLIKEISKWSTTQKNEFSNLSIKQTIKLAFELETFLKEVKKKNLSLTDLKTLIENRDEYSQHWQKIIDFLEVFGTRWNEFMKQNNFISPYDYKLQLLELNNEFLKNKKPEFPIIVAGFMDSTNLTLKFLNTILKHNNCYLILKGFENLDQETWENIDEFHPQFLIKYILKSLKYSPEKIQEVQYSKFITCNNEIQNILTTAMMPASQTYKWQNLESITQNSITQINCKNNHEEINIVFAILKNFISNNKNKSVALVINDLDFAKNIELKFNKIDIHINNSFGDKLLSCKTTSYLFLLIETINNNFSPTKLLSLLKHPFANFGYTKQEFEKNLNLFEEHILRGGKIDKGFGYFISQAKKLNSTNITVLEKQSLIKWLENIFNTLNPLIKILTKKQHDFHDLLKNHIKTAETIFANNLWNIDESGEELYKIITELLKESSNHGIIKTQDYLILLSYFISENTFHKKYHVHSAINILPPKDARLLNHDLIILSQLNENHFPNVKYTDPWMNKQMRNNFGFDPKEIEISNFAFDFVQLLSQKQVILTRALKEQGITTTKSRFLFRLEAVLNKINSNIPELNQWKKVIELYNKPEKLNKIPRPKPKPPIELRPKKLSATNIETLIKNPYEIYAKKILNLYEKEKIEEQNTFLAFGNSVHEALENFVSNYHQIEEQNKLNQIIEYGKKSFEKHFNNSFSKDLWWHRFNNIAQWFIKNEQKLRENNCEILAEKKGKITIQEIDFILEAKADRIQIHSNGNTDIIDYKTGMIPSLKSIEQGKSPQLTIEALIAQNKGFNTDKEIKTIQNLEYWKTTGNKEELEIKKTNKNLDELITEAKQGIIKLIIHFNNLDNTYTATTDIHRENQYKHLSRIEEWIYN